MEYHVVTAGKVRCHRCGHVNVISPDLFEETFHNVISNNENGMGETIEVDIEADACCIYCSNDLLIKAVLTEYPVNWHESGPDYDTQGCDLLSPPEIEYENTEEIDFYDPDEYGYESIEAAEDELEKFVANPELLRTISPREFEETVCEILGRYGFETTLTKATRDGGKDIIAKGYSGGFPFVVYIECKQYRPGKKVGIDVVRKMQAVQSDAHVNMSIVVTTSSFTSGAVRYAEEHNMPLVDWNLLKEKLADAVNYNAAGRGTIR